jgi:hypothetical protein
MERIEQQATGEARTPAVPPLKQPPRQIDRIAPFTAQEFEGRGVVVRPFLPRIDFEFAAVFPPQRSPSPAALDLVEVMRQVLDELSGLPVAQN